MPKNKLPGQAWKKQALLFLTSQNLSLFGSSVTGFAIIWYVTLQTSSGLWMTLIVLSAMLPQVFISLWAGVLADRHNRKRLIMGADGGIALATLLLAIFYLSGFESLELLLLASAVRSVGAGIQTPAVNAVIPQIVPTEKLTRFNGINQSLNATLQLLAPAVGGVVLGMFGIAWAFMLDVITAALAIIILHIIPIKKIISEARKTTMWSDLKQGLCYAWSTLLIKRLIICYGAAFFLITPAAFLTPIMIERSFGNDVWLLTTNELAWGLGSLLGGSYIAWRGMLKDKIRTIALSLTAFGITFALLGLAPFFSLYLIFMGIAGFFLPLFATAETVLIQEKVEAQMMGRVFSILQITAMSAMPVAMLLFGPLADIIKIELILVITGLLLSMVGLLFLRYGQSSAAPDDH